MFRGAAILWNSLELSYTKNALINITLFWFHCAYIVFQITFANDTDSKIAEDKQNFLDRNYKEQIN